MEILHVAVIGLGMMGTPLASRLLKADYSVTGYDVVAKRMEDLAEIGLKPSSSPGEAARGAELVILPCELVYPHRSR